MHTLPKALQEKVLKTERYRSFTGDEVKIGVFRHKGRRLVVTWSRKRARKDASDRERAIRTLIAVRQPTCPPPSTNLAVSSSRSEGRSPNGGWSWLRNPEQGLFFEVLVAETR